ILWALGANKTVSTSLRRNIKTRLIQLGEDKAVAKAHSQYWGDDGPQSGKLKIARQEMKQVDKETTRWFSLLVILVAAHLVGSWLGISRLKLTPSDWYLFCAALGLIAVSWIVGRYAKLLLNALDETRERSQPSNY